MDFDSELLVLRKLSAASQAKGWLQQEARWERREFAPAKRNTKNYPLFLLFTPGTPCSHLGFLGNHEHC